MVIKNGIIACLWLWATLTSLIAFANEPPNLETIKQQIKAYYESGEYRRETTEVTLLAQNYLKQRITANNNAAVKKKLAIVLDIDETAISNFKNYHQPNFVGIYEDDIAKLVLKSNSPAIPPILNLYRYAKSHGVAVFFVSGRKQKYENLTIKNLKNAGYYNWDGLYLVPNDYAQPSAVYFKSNARKQITEAGYDIVINLGDQKSDLDGGYADQIFKVPNPFYLIP